MSLEPQDDAANVLSREMACLRKSGFWLLVLAVPAALLFLWAVYTGHDEFVINLPFNVF